MKEEQKNLSPEELEFLNAIDLILFRAKTIMTERLSSYGLSQGYKKRLDLILEGCRFHIDSDTEFFLRNIVGKLARFTNNSKSNDLKKDDLYDIIGYTTLCIQHLESLNVKNE